MSRTVAEFAPAKVNLHLHVTGKRADGYHLLDSLVVFADIGDRLTLSPSADLTLEVTGPFAAGLTDEPDNLVLRAARAVAERAGMPAAGHFVLEKNLPVASGIGGGSSDAAAAVRLMLRQCSATLDPDTIDDIALLLGADVPVCLRRRTTRMSGIGDWLADWPPFPKVGLLLVNPGLPIPTRTVFNARDSEFSPQADLPSGGWPDAAAMTSALRATRNDLEAPARRIAPVIGEVLDTITALPGCLLARMSGSGATCFGIFPDPRAARAAVSLIANKAWWCQGGGLYEDAAALESRI